MFLVKNKCLLYDLLGMKKYSSSWFELWFPERSNLDKLPVYILFDRKEKNELNYVKKKRYKNSLKYKQSKQRRKTNTHNNTRESNQTFVQVG